VLREWQWLSVQTRVERGSPSPLPKAKVPRPFSASPALASRRFYILHHWGNGTLALPPSDPNNGSERSSDGLSCSDTGRAARGHRSRASHASSKSKQEYDADHVGISSLVAEEAIRKAIDEMRKELLIDKISMLMPLNEDNGAFRDKLAVWFRGLSDGSDNKLA